MTSRIPRQRSPLIEAESMTKASDRRSLIAAIVALLTAAFFRLMWFLARVHPLKRSEAISHRVFLLEGTSIAVIFEGGGRSHNPTGCGNEKNSRFVSA
jgi:hypothetical protein